MEKSNEQLERNVAASFGYVKKDVLMLNDSYTKMQEAISQLANNYKVLTEEVRKLKAGKSKSTPKKVAKKKVTKKVVKKTTKAKPKVTKKVTKTTKAPKKDDLTVIEGVGPVLQRYLNKNKILTLKQLSKKSGKELKKLLDKEGTKYQMHDPSSWPKQAKLAHEGKFKELKKYQDTLNSNKGPKAPRTTVKKKGVKKIVKTETTYE